MPPTITENLSAGSKVIWPLQALNFFMADVQAGIGPFLGIFLLAYGWQSGAIGTVMTIGGIAGMLMTAPAGAIIDNTNSKRGYVVGAAAFTVLASLTVLVSQNFWIISASQAATGIAGAILGPALIGITLGIVKQDGFNRQNGHNQAYNHAGNVVGATCSGYLGYKFGIHAILMLSAAFGVMSVISVLMIPAKAIDDKAARGMKEDGAEDDKANGIKTLFQNKSLLILAAALACFHLGNAAMLPLYGMAAASRLEGDPSIFVALTIIIAQVVMIGASIVAMKMADKKGYWLVLLISFIALPIRGLIAGTMINRIGLYPVQALDGIGAGLQSVAVPGLVARLLNGTGRINVGQGAVMTVQSIGAALSPAIGGWMAQSIGYPSTFMILGSFASVSIFLWLSFSKTLRNKCDNQPAVDCRDEALTSSGKH